MKGITKKLRGLVFCLIFFAALTLAGRVEARAAGTVTVTVERFVLGGDFIVQPEIVPVKDGDTYADVIKKVLDGHNIKFDWTFGTQYNSYYLQNIKGVDPGTSRIPKVLLDTVYKSTTIGDNSKSPDLGEFSYTQAAGWMYYVDNKYVLGLSSVPAVDGQVMRFMFSLVGGSDLIGQKVTMTGSNVVYGEKYFDVADKSELIRRMGIANQNKSNWSSGMYNAYTNAVNVMAKMDASQNDVNEAIQMLDASGSIGQTDKLTVSLNKSSLSLNQGETDSLRCTVSPSAANPSVSWSSSNTNVATVDSSSAGAIVTAKAPGTATITATAKSGSKTGTASCTVTVAGSGGDFAKGAPVISSLKADSATSVTVSWEAYPGAESYTVLRQEIGGKFTPIKEGVTGTTYTDKTAKADTTYFYSVQAVKGGEMSDYEKGQSVDTPQAGSVKPGKAVIDSVEAAAYNKLTVTWGEVENATGYYVQRSTSKGKGYKTVKTIKSGSTTSYTDIGVSTGKKYYYKIQAYNKTGKKTQKGAASAAESGSTKLGSTTVTATPASKKATVKWTKVAGANGYVVCRAASENGKYKSVKTVTKGGTTSFTNKKLSAGKTYYYKVRAYRKVSGKKVYSAYSEPVSVQIP